MTNLRNNLYDQALRVAVFAGGTIAGAFAYRRSTVITFTTRSEFGVATPDSESIFFHVALAVVFTLIASCSFARLVAVVASAEAVADAESADGNPGRIWGVVWVSVTTIALIVAGLGVGVALQAGADEDTVHQYTQTGTR